MLKYLKYVLYAQCVFFSGLVYAQPDALNASTPSAADASQNSAVDEALDAEQRKPMVLDTLDIKDMDINDVLKLLATKSGLNIIAGKNITGRVTIFLQNVEVHDALTIILKANDLAYMEARGVVQIMTAAEYEQTTGHKFGVNTESTIVALQSAKASDLVAVLNQVKSQAGKVIAEDESNSIIIEDVPEKVTQLMDFIKTMDVPTQLQVYRLKHIVGDTLVPKLQDMASPKIGSVKLDTLSNTLFLKDTPQKLEEMMKYISDVDTPRVTRVFNINYAKADEMAKTLAPMLTKDVGSIEYDARSNTLVVMDVAPKVEEIGAMIDAMDKNDKEVFIEAKIIQITLGDEYQMGVNWDKIIQNIGHTSLQLGSAFPIPGGVTSQVGALSIGTLSSGTFNDVVQAMDTFGKSRTLSSPRLAVINNQEASILIGTTTPYTTSTTTTPASGPVTSSESVSFIDTGVKLHVTPTIHGDGYVTMKIKPEISNEESKPFTAADGTVIPIVDTSEVQTTVRVKDGVTIIIGGLMKNELINNKNKIPILGDLPFLGKAFSSEDRNVQKTEIVIFLTPHIINGDVRANPDEYLKNTETLKGEKTYYDPLPRDESTVPVP